MSKSFSNRLREGDTVDFCLCDELRSGGNHTFFKKDGGWGIAKKDGEIILSNHFTCPFGSRLGFIDESLFVVKDVDTGLYGVISRNKAKEILPFIFTFIETVVVNLPDSDPILIRNSPKTNEIDLDRPITYRRIRQKLLFKVNKGGYINSDRYSSNSVKFKEGGLWGIYDESGNIVINVRYYDISIASSHFECRSTEDYENEDYGYNKFGMILSCRKYIGKIDLYNFEGVFIVGGVDSVSYQFGHIILYSGIKYKFEKEIITESTFHGDYKFELYHNVPDYSDASCIILNSQYKPILKSKSRYKSFANNFFRLGMTFKDNGDFCESLSSEVIFDCCSVNLCAIDNNIIFLSLPDELYVIPEFISKSNNISIVDVLTNGHIEHVEYNNGIWEDHVIEDTLSIILKISDEGFILWSHRVNEIGFDNYGKNMFYRDGEKVGLFTTDGFSFPKFQGIVKELQQNGKLIIAIKEDLCDDKCKHNNFNNIDNTRISYYELENNGTLVKLSDIRKNFDAREYNWFPEKFKEDNGLFYDDIYDNSNDYIRGWTMSELEDAADAAYEGHSRLELGLE